MTTIANSKDPHLLAAVAHYAETKCLLGGVTTSQGISLKADQLQRTITVPYARPTNPTTPIMAKTHIPDVDASQWAQFKRRSRFLPAVPSWRRPGQRALNAFLALNNGRNGRSVRPWPASIARL